MEWLKPLSSQWQLALLALVLVMGSLVWRMHRQVTMLGGTSEKMREQLVMLSRSVDGIEGSTTNTEHTLIANLSEYRMAMGSTSQYREYLQKLGVAPTSDVEPILEALPDGAIAVSKDGRILYANRFMSESTGIYTGMTLEEIVQGFDVRSMEGESLTLDALPETRVLAGEEVREALVRLRAPGAEHPLVLFVNGCPVRDVVGRIVAAVMVARPISEEVALAIQVRQFSVQAGGNGAVRV
jgi:PAS domain-containing protein